MPRKKHAGTKRKAADISQDEDPPFTITCPALDTAKRAKPGDNTQNLEDHPGDPKLNVRYTVEPRQKWADTRSYKKMKYKEHEFSLGDFVFIKRRSVTTAEADGALGDMDEDQLLEWQRQNTWIGRIREVKAMAADQVYMRLFWLYWPDELPRGGREPHHGKREVVLSNHADIVDSMTISGPADIRFWDENDDKDGPRGQLFWRQTLDISKRQPVLSKLRKHCKCRREHQPDNAMYQCSNQQCLTWNHKQCLSDGILDNLKSRLHSGGLEKYLDDRAEELRKKQQDRELSFGERITVGAENLLHRIQHSVDPLLDSKAKTPPTDNGCDAEAALSSRPKPELAAATAEEEGEEESAPQTDGRLTITIKRKAVTKNITAEIQLRPAKGEKDVQTKSWEIQMACLVCGKPLD